MKLKRIVFSLVAIIIIVLSALFTLRADKELSRIVNRYNGIYFSEDNLISLYSYHGKESFSENVEEITDFIEKCPLEVYVAVPPRKMDVLKKFLPEQFPFGVANNFFDTIKESASNYIDLYSLLFNKSEYAGHLYFKTDHHWTSDGAYLAYCEIISALGKEPIKEESFEKELFTDTYRGSDWSKLKKDELFDSIYLYYHESFSDMKVTQVSFPFDSEENNSVQPSFYLTDRKNSYDPYTVYFGGNSAYIRIENGKEREKLLVIRDSFASALAPFLACHYDLVLIDPRFYPERISKAIEREKPDKVLIVENMGSFTENTIKITY